MVALIATCFALIVPLPLLLYSATAAGTDPPRGQQLFERRCTGCHRLDDVRSGPRLRGVFGRAAGADPGFPYSNALKSARLTWDEATLDRWLTDPEAVVPNNDMAFRISNADERAEIIAYLKGLSH